MTVGIGPTIVRAVPADAAEVADFAARVFQESYGKDNSADDLALHLSRTYTPALQHAEISDPSAQFMLARCNDVLAGYGFARPHPAPSCSTLAPAVQLRRFYVDQRWHGTGVAPLLMRALLASIAATGAAGVWLTSWSQATRALRFYARQGFVDVGSSTFTLGESIQHDRVLEYRFPPP